MNKMEGCMRWADGIGVSIFEKRLPEGLCGIYIDSQRTIILDTSLSATQRKCTLTHELVHAQYHDDLRYDTQGYCERRARKITAARLIDRAAYEQAAEAYEYNEFLMCDALDVTVMVLHDFARWCI